MPRQADLVLDSGKDEPFLFNSLMSKPSYEKHHHHRGHEVLKKNNIPYEQTTDLEAVMPQLFIDRELGEMLLQLQDIRKRFDAYLDTHNDPKKFTPCEAAFEVEGDLANAMIGVTKMIACRMADELFDGQHEADAPAC